MKAILNEKATLFVGKMGCGKTSMLAKIASVYRKAYPDPHELLILCTEPGIENTDYCPFEWLGYFWNSCGTDRPTLLLIDELSLCANSRDFKSIDKLTRDYFRALRHDHLTTYAFTQNFNDGDLQIRNAFHRIYHAKRWYFGLSIYRLIDKDMYLKENQETGVGDFIDGYAYAPLLVPGSLMFCKLSRYYKYFNSYSRLGNLPDLPLLPDGHLDYKTAYKTYTDRKKTARL